MRWIDGADLADRDPFTLEAEADPIARADMGQVTLAVIGAQRADGRPGFILLADRADPNGGDIGGAEELLDHSCRQFLRPQ